MAPPNADFKRVYAAGQQTVPIDVLAIYNSMAQGGAFDYQRDAPNKVFYDAYRHAANYAVGVFMAGAGFSRDSAIAISQTYAFFYRRKPRKTSNNKCFGQNVVGTMGIAVIGNETPLLARMDRFHGQPCPYSWSSRFPMPGCPFSPGRAISTMRRQSPMHAAT